MMPTAIPQPDTQATPQPPAPPGGDGPDTEPGPMPGPVTGPDTEPRPVPPAPSRNSVVIKFKAGRDKLFKSFPAIANLADKSDDGKISIEVTGTSQSGFDESWLRNAVEEPLDEADVERE